MPPVSITHAKVSTTFRVDRKEKRPVDVALVALEDNNTGALSYRYVDLSSLKPGRFGEGDLERLLDRLPDESGVTYTVALPEQLVQQGSSYAHEVYGVGKGKQANVVVMNKTSAAMHHSQVEQRG